MQREFQSADVARAAVRMALSETRADENELKEKLAAQGIRSVAVNFGGKFIGIARWKEHLCGAVFGGVGVLHFNEVTIGLAHRVLRNDLTD